MGGSASPHERLLRDFDLRAACWSLVTYEATRGKTLRRCCASVIIGFLPNGPDEIYTDVQLVFPGHLSTQVRQLPPLKLPRSSSHFCIGSRSYFAQEIHIPH